jgi:hypothetical protein
VPGQASRSGADFQHHVLGPDLGGVGHPAEGIFIDKEVLAEGFSRPQARVS